MQPSLEIISKFTQNKTVPFDDNQSAMDWLVSWSWLFTGIIRKT